MAIVTFLDNGEITGVFSMPVDLSSFPLFIEVDDELANAIIKRNYAYRVQNGNVVEIKIEPAKVVKRFDERMTVSGVVIDDVCYAVHASALSLLAASMATGNHRALVHGKSGDYITTIDRELAEAIVDAAFEHIEGALAK